MSDCSRRERIKIAIRRKKLEDRNNLVINKNSNAVEAHLPNQRKIIFLISNLNFIISSL